MVFATPHYPLPHLASLIANVLNALLDNTIHQLGPHPSHLALTAAADMHPKQAHLSAKRVPKVDLLRMVQAITVVVL